MATYNDFTGFTFNGTHSSDLNILRVSNGSRYSEYLLPTFSDTTMRVTGTGETYYWDSEFTQRQISIQIAYDSMTETGLRKLRQLFGTKEICDLIFDEAPYKIYRAKVQQAPQLTYVCFDDDGQRVYKGEGTINFICYYPFAHSRFKYLDQYSAQLFANKDEWSGASGMLSTQSDYDTVNSSIKVYNPGDLEAPITLYYSISSVSSDTLRISLRHTTDVTPTIAGLNISAITAIGSDTHIGINTKTQLIDGYTLTVENNQNVWTKTGHAYNRYVTSGTFFKIPQCTNTSDYYKIYSTVIPIEIQYNYLYY